MRSASAGSDSGGSSTITADDAPKLYRLHIRPAGNAAHAFRYCLDEGLLGTGWGTTRWIDPQRSPAGWDDYLTLARKEWSNRALVAVRSLHDAPIGSLVWTRDPHGIYYLAKLTGDWEYRDAEINRDLDLNNVRPAHIVAAPDAEASVPGAVVRSFSGRGQALRRVPDHGAAVYSAYLFARLAGEEPPSWSPTHEEVLDSLLGPFDVEDLIAAYLQVERGFIALPARRSDSKLAYEYTLRDPTDGRVFAVQVKTGDESVPVDQLPDTDGLRWLIFSPRTRYPTPLPPHVKGIEPSEVLRFIRDKPLALPPVVQTWLSFNRSI